MKRVLASALGICGVIWLPLAGMAAPAATPSLQTIVERTVAHDEARQKTLQSMQYDQTANLDELNDKGDVVKHETLQMIVYPGGNPSMKIVSVKGDRVPSDPDQAEAQSKGRDVEDNKNNFTLKELVNRFDLSLAGETQLNGHEAYIIAFVPKANQPYHNETEKIVNQLHGRIWVSADSYDVLQTEASLAEPVSVAWFIAKISRVDFHYSRPDISKEFTPCQVQIAVEVHAVFMGFYERQIVDMKNFRPRS